MLDKDGKLPRVGRALMADAIGTVAGACLGTSTVTSYVAVSYTHLDVYKRQVLLGRTVEVQPCSFAVVTDP